MSLCYFPYIKKSRFLKCLSYTNYKLTNYCLNIKEEIVDMIINIS